MKKPNKLIDLANEKGVTVEQLITTAINETGSRSGAALKLNVTTGAIDYWINKLGLKIVTWAKVIQAQAS